MLPEKRLAPGGSVKWSHVKPLKQGLCMLMMFPSQEETTRVGVESTLFSRGVSCVSGAKLCFRRLFALAVAFLENGCLAAVSP